MSFVFHIQDLDLPDCKTVDESLSELWEGFACGGGSFSFATVTGVKLMLEDDEFKEFIKTGKFTLIVGAESVTNVKTLKYLASLRDKYNKKGKHLDVKAYYNEKAGRIHHPKFSWVSDKEMTKGKLLGGSGNLTVQGLQRNTEGYIVGDCNKKIMQQIIDKWNKWVNVAEQYLYEVDDEELLEIVDENHQKAFAQMRKAVKGKGTSDQFSHLQQMLVDWQASSDEAYWRINRHSDILIAEIPRSGDRWKQANFPKEIFERYFGAKSGVNGKHKIMLRSVHYDGSLGRNEIRPSVSVKSKNYRFELDAATGLEYPDGFNAPVAIFARVNNFDFVYELVMPHQKNAYKAVASFISRHRMVKSLKQKRMFRGVYSFYDVEDVIKSLGLQYRLDG